MNQPRILIFDIETAPMEVYTFRLHDQNIGLNQVKKDWHLLAWAAKWLGDPPHKVMYMDNRRARNVDDDKALVKGLAKLLNEADVIVTQNGDAFDVKKLNARAAILKLPPIKPCKSTDILKEGRKVFSFTSHKLEYVTGVLNKKYKKLDHREYPGLELWKAVLKGDRRAWCVMEKYTRHDVLSTEEAYQNIQGWIRTQNVAMFSEDTTMRCYCGSDRLEARGYARTESGKYRVYHCKNCGKWPRSKKNLLDQDKKASLLRHK